MAPTHIAGLEIPWTDSVRPEDTTDMFPYIEQVRKTEILPKGWQKTKNTRPLPCDVIYDQNVEMSHSDGVKIYMDIIRPASTKEKIPALLALSPYGKNGHGFDIYGNTPFRLGIPENRLSGLEKFESVDPAEWAARGYALVNVDIRGSWESEGDIYIEGSQPGIDAAEIVEEVAKMSWCNGSIGMQGNSWLATTQWTTAARRPPSLKAIAPWEGFIDKYRDVALRGGIPSSAFLNFIYNRTIRGRQKREDVHKATQLWPLINEYWEDKVIDVSDVDIPIYAVSSYSTPIHGFGTVKAFRQARSQKKWLRFHPNQEWYDLYREDSTNDLQKFFDRYLKNIDNDWEKTPSIRVSILTMNGRSGPGPIENHVFSDYPPKETEYRVFHLSESRLLPNPVPKYTKVSYQSDDTSAKPAEFTYVFDKVTTLVGYSKAKLWVSCDDMDDMDIYLSIRKISKSGKILAHSNIPFKDLPEGVDSADDIPNANTVKYLGPTGILRASHRAQDPQLSTTIIPHHPHKIIEKVPPGKIIPVEIGIWPIGMHFEQGEGLILRVQGFLDRPTDFPQHISSKPDNLNFGKHAIHTGGKYHSCLSLPVVNIGCI